MSGERPLKVKEAIEVLRRAMRGRPWVFVYEKFHPDAENWSTILEHGRQAGYVTIGMLRRAEHVEQLRYDDNALERDTEGDKDDEDEATPPL